MIAQVGDDQRLSDQEEHDYKWMERGCYYSDALKTVPVPSGKGTLLEGLGYSLYRASLQSDKEPEFQDRIHRSITSYQSAIVAHRQSSREAEALRCQAMEEYLAFSISHTLHRGRRLLGNAWRLTVRSLEAFRKIGDDLGFGRTYNLLSPVGALRYRLEWNSKSRQSLAWQGVSLGEGAAERVSRTENPEDLARSCTITASFMGMVSYYLDPSGREKLIAKSEEWLRRGIAILRESNSSRNGGAGSVLASSIGSSWFRRGACDDGENAGIC